MHIYTYMHIKNKHRKYLTNDSLIYHWYLKYKIWRVVGCS